MTTFDFTSPEGKTYSVDGPDGATHEQAFQMLQQHLGTQGDAAKPFESANPTAAAHVGRMAKNPTVQTGRAPPETWADFGAGVRDAVEQGGTGVNEAVARGVARPLDAASNLLNKPAEMVTGQAAPNSHAVENAFRGAFVDNHPQPTTDAQRIMRAGGNMVGDNLPFAAAGAAAAGIPRLAFESAAPVAGNIWQTLGAGVRNYGDAMARSPVKSFVGDTTGAGESGAGGELYRQRAQDDDASPGGQRGAELAGQLAVPAAAAAYTKYGPGGMFRMATSKVTDAVLHHLPEEVLPASLRPAGGSADARKAEQLAFSNNEGKYAANEGVNDVQTKDLPVQPPAAPGFVARKMDAGAQARADEATNVVAKDMGKITARPEAAANMAEAARLKAEIPGFEPGIAKETGDAAMLNKQANFDSKATNDELRARQDAHDSSRTAVRDYMDKTVPAAGANPQDRVAEANRGAIQAKETELGAQADALEGKIKDINKTLPEAKRANSGAALRDIHETAETASGVRTAELRKAIANPDTPIQVGDKPMTINEALDRRAAINQEQRKYASTIGTVEGADRMAQLSAERSTLDKAVEGVNQPGMKEYRDYYRDEHVPKYQEGAGRDVIRYDRFGYGKNEVPDEKVLAQFGGPNNISAAKQFTATHGNNPEAVRLMEDHQLGRLKAEAVDENGAIKKGAVDKFLTKNKELLDVLPPSVREKVSAKNPDALYRQLGELEQRQRAASDSKLGQLANKGATPEAHIDAGLNDWQVMKDLRNSVRGDPQAEASLRRAVWDRVTAAAGKGPIDAAALEKMLAPESQGGHRRSLAQVFDTQHLNNLDNVIAASRIEDRLPRPTGTHEKPTNAFSRFEEATGTSVPSLGATMSALARGRSSPVYEVPRVIANAWKGISEREINGIWKEALSNPQVAKQLSVVAKGGVATPMQIKRMRNYTLALGIHDAEENDDPYKGPK